MGILKTADVCGRLCDLFVLGVRDLNLRLADHYTRDSIQRDTSPLYVHWHVLRILVRLSMPSSECNANSPALPQPVRSLLPYFRSSSFKASWVRDKASNAGRGKLCLVSWLCRNSQQHLSSQCSTKLDHAYRSLIA